MHFFPEYQKLFTGIDSDTLILTPNQRLSRFLTVQFDFWGKKQGKPVWPTLDCMSLSLWLVNLWERIQIGAMHPKAHWQVMTPAQERSVWLQAIDLHPVEYLLSYESMADLSAQAWRFLRLWNKKINDLPGDTEEAVLLKLWITAYQDICNNKKMLDTTEVALLARESIAEGFLMLPKKLVCIGFDELSPVDECLIESLKRQGINVEFTDVSMIENACRVEQPNSEIEVQCAARWAAKLIEVEPSASIGIVIPDLANLRPVIERVFTSVFEPQYIFPGKPRHATAFNISAGQPLAQTSIIATALAALQLNKREVDRDVLSQLLTAPFVGVEIEYEGYIKLKRSLNQRYIKVPVTALHSMTANIKADDGSYLCPLFHQQLQTFGDVVRPYKNGRQSYSKWGEIFNQQIFALGWPGERELDTLEFQQLTHWPELISELSKLDQVSSPVALNDALAELNKLAYIPFHAQTNDSPVQVLGMLEAAGQHYDHLWIMGMDYRAWPEACSPNPLIPVALQREWCMPRSSMDRELSLAKKLTKRLSCSAYKVIFSSANFNGDQPLRPSPLIEDLPLVDSDSLGLFRPPSYINLMLDQATTEPEDSIAPLILNAKHIRGGAQLLKNQAACPFLAFAKHRLHAVVPEDFELGISALIRGNLMHKVLELIWNHLETQKALLKIEALELDLLIDESILNAWLDIVGHEQIGPCMKRIEQQRTKKLVIKWLEIEKNRAPFRVVFHEKAQTFQVGEIPLVIRYDRMDELAEGGFVVIDYKTGIVDIKAWSGERLDDPQVPLYCVSMMNTPPEAAVFAQVNIKGVEAKGISPTPEVIPGLKAPEDLKKLDLPNEWAATLQFWQQALEQLADSFVAGDARVDPKKPNTTCSFCDLKSLCRVGCVE